MRNISTSFFEIWKQLEALQQKVNKLATKNKNLEERVDILENTKRKLCDKVELLESKIIISEGVTSKLVREVDRLDQYNRRSNLIIKNIELKENKTYKDVEKIVNKVLKEDLDLPAEVLNDIDKFHCNGFVKKISENKKKQNIIVRFKSHSSSYACLSKK